MISASAISWLNANTLLHQFVSWLGPWALIGVLIAIFFQTGPLLGFFLPGDSLLFVLGAFWGAGTIKTPLPYVLIGVFLAAALGTQCGYLIGHTAGPKIFSKNDSRFLKKEYIERANGFFEKHGSVAIIMTIFVPIIRPFTPIVAGAAKMRYRNFLLFSLIGALIWAVGVTLLGIAFGNIGFIKNNIELILVAIVVISVLPMVFTALRSKLRSRKQTQA